MTSSASDYVYDPKSLPATSSVQVFTLGKPVNHIIVVDQKIQTVQIDLNGSEIIFTLDSHYSYIASNPVILTGKDAKEICDVWQQLPESEEVRCHTPVFGLYLMNGDEIHTIASICWRCDNIVVMNNSERKSYGFDSRSEAGQKLFQLLTDYSTAAQ